jgi:hypothetical protein
MCVLPFHHNLIISASQTRPSQSASLTAPYPYPHFPAFQQPHKLPSKTKKPPLKNTTPLDKVKQKKRRTYRQLSSPIKILLI